MRFLSLLFTFDEGALEAVLVLRGCVQGFGYEWSVVIFDYNCR